MTLPELFFVYIRIIKYYLFYFSYTSFFKYFVRFCLCILYEFSVFYDVNTVCAENTENVTLYLTFHYT